MSKNPWMNKTSDVFGSHQKTDIDSHLALIRRKIQERCSTTTELIQTIRRNKISDSIHVTPNEFRFTLIKFGIIFDQVRQVLGFYLSLPCIYPVLTCLNLYCIYPSLSSHWSIKSSMCSTLTRAAPWTSTNSLCGS
jgi:hypothetical protein